MDELRVRDRLSPESRSLFQAPKTLIYIIITLEHSTVYVLTTGAMKNTIMQGAIYE